jgi:hypothetical protein
MIPTEIYYLVQFIRLHMTLHLKFLHLNCKFFAQIEDEFRLEIFYFFSFIIFSEEAHGLFLGYCSHIV